MKSNVFALLLALLFVGTAHAERVIVIMKDEQSFQAVHQAYKLKGSYSLNGFKAGGLKNGLNAVNGKVEDTLKNLKTIVVDVKSDEDIAKLQSSPAVAYVEKEIFYAVPRPVKGALSAAAPSSEKIGKNTPWGIHAVKAPQAWSVYNQGEGARVLVLDTGIDENHPALKDNFEKGMNFNAGSPASDYKDENGHGTHVAGTVAATMGEDGFVGVAPKAKILAGRVCSNDGCSSIGIIQGINWGVEEKVDVISMSLGGAWPSAAQRDAVAKADRAGVTVVAASGNDGTGRVSYPAAYPGAIAVGAVDIDLNKADFSQYGKELAIVAPGVAVVSSVPQGTGREASATLHANGEDLAVNANSFVGGKELLKAETNVLVPAGLGKVEDFKKVDVKGFFALIQRGEINFSEKVKNAINAGAAGVVIYNNAPGLIQGALTDDGSTLPVGVFMIEQTVGMKALELIAQNKEVAMTLQTKATDYSAFDGTSMATPHVSGVVALMKAANKHLNGAEVKAILTKTATRLSGPNNNNELGAGLVNAEEAVKAALDAKQLELPF